MLNETLAALETSIHQARSLTDENKAELLCLLTTLKTEMVALAETHAEHAESIAGFTAVSTHEVVRQPRNPHLVELALQGLSSSVEELETSHPQLVRVVNSLCALLSNIGI